MGCRTARCRLLDACARACHARPCPVCGDSYGGGRAPGRWERNYQGRSPLSPPRSRERAPPASRAARSDGFEAPRTQRTSAALERLVGRRGYSGRRPFAGSGRIPHSSTVALPVAAVPGSLRASGMQWGWSMFSGSIVALVTPFRDGAVDEAALEALVDWHVESGTSALVPVGTTGESPTLSHDEHEKVVEIVVRKSAGRLPVIAGTGSNSTEEATRFTRHAFNAGADAALVVVPYYNKPTRMGCCATSPLCTIARSFRSSSTTSREGARWTCRWVPWRTSQSCRGSSV